jgi:hypothetical protein
MRRFVLSLLLAGAVATGVGSSAVAAPSPVHITVSSKAQFVSPTTLLVPVTVTCQVGTASVNVFVQQPDTAGNGSGFTSVPCTGDAETVVVVVNGGPFTLGQAFARGFVSSFVFFDDDIRRIQIVL